MKATRASSQRARNLGWGQLSLTLHQVDVHRIDNTVVRLHCSRLPAPEANIANAMRSPVKLELRIADMGHAVTKSAMLFGKSLERLSTKGDRHIGRNEETGYCHCRFCLLAKETCK